MWHSTSAKASGSGIEGPGGGLKLVWSARACVLQTCGLTFHFVSFPHLKLLVLFPFKWLRNCSTITKVQLNQKIAAHLKTRLYFLFRDLLIWKTHFQNSESKLVLNTGPVNSPLTVADCPRKFTA